MSRNRNKNSIQKGSTVWYFDREIKEWRKGTVFSVNRLGLGIKKRHNAYKGFARYSGLVILSSEPKPTVLPSELVVRLRALSRFDGWDRETIRQTRAYRFLMKLGLK